MPRAIGVEEVSVSTKRTPPSRGQQKVHARDGSRVTPIYRHLPRGPHGLDARQIAAHQRTRIQGALVEAVARDGYDALTVRAVIGLAGVSRRSFYEHFENRHDCFMKTAAALARSELAAACKTWQAATGTARGPRLRAAFEVLATGWREHPDAARLVLLETLVAGDDGAALLVETTGAGERMLATALGAGQTMPTPILRALAGAIHGSLTAALGTGPPVDPEALSAIALAQLVPVKSVPALARALSRHAGAALAVQRSAPLAGTPRERVLKATLLVAAHRPARQLTVPEIADEAGVRVGELLEMFDGPGDCLQTALCEAGERVVSIVRQARSGAGEPTQLTRLALAGVLSHFAGDPAQARGLALIAHRAGPEAAGRVAELDRLLGEDLATEGPVGRMPPAAATGALWHIVRHALLADGAQLLPALSDYLAYVLLAPALGAEAAIAALDGSLRDS